MFKQVLSDQAQIALALLGESKLLNNCYLAGGSALALHLGHRHSEDFDFFTPDIFDPHLLSSQLSKLGDFKEEFAKGITLLGEFHEIKFSCFKYDYPLLGPTSQFLGVNIASPEDIAPMKLAAVMDRSTRRDYIDLYMLVKKGLSFEQMFELYDQKYHKLESNLFSLTKSLSYFDEADNSTMPRMIEQITWEEVKKFCSQESVRLGNEHLYKSSN